MPEEYSAKKGGGFGAFGGFVASIAFAGIISAMPLLFGMPTGLFLHGLGLLVTAASADDSVLIGMAAFAAILVQGIAIGIIFGLLTSRVPSLRISNRKKGVGLGLVAGFIAYLAIYVPVMVAMFPGFLSRAVATYPEERLSLFGADYGLTTTWGAYLAGTLGLGLVSYLAYGAIMGGAVALQYSVYHFIAGRKEQEQRASA